MNAQDDGQSVLIRVMAVDAGPGGKPVRGVARIDLTVTAVGSGLASPESWRVETSSAVDLGDLADPAVLRSFVWEWPQPQAVAAFDARAWDVFTPAVIGENATIDLRKVVCAVWPDLPSPLEADPAALLAREGGRRLLADAVPQPDRPLARLVEATASLLSLALLGEWLDGDVWDRVAALVRLSAVPPQP